MSLAKHRPNTREAFTLLELLIVMAIIAVLVSLSLSALMKARETSNRVTCTNNLRQMGFAFQTHHSQFNYYPTAGAGDFTGPSYNNNAGAGTSPVAGWNQTAGWAFQLLPYMDAESVWSGDPTQTAAVNLTAIVARPQRFYFCPTRRSPTAATYTNAAFPAQSPVYDAIRGTNFTVGLIDYAGCNSSAWPGGGSPLFNTGLVRSQAFGKNIVRQDMITDGLSTTLMLGEKAVNPNGGAASVNEDDMGYAAGFTAVNFNTVRFTAANLLPVRDKQLIAASGGAFGSAHVGTWNALMADGSVQALSYSIDPAVYSGLGTIAGKEPISDIDLTP